MRKIVANCLTVLVPLGGIVAAGCTELTEAPYNEITEANFSPTEADLAALIGPVYTPQRGIWMSWYGMVDW